MTRVILLVVTVLLVPLTMHGQTLNIRGAGCIGPCHSITCCGTTVVVNENGVGLGRNVDCRGFMKSAPPDQRRAFCSLVRDLAQSRPGSVQPTSMRLPPCVKEALKKILPLKDPGPLRDSLDRSGANLDELEVVKGSGASTKDKIQLDNELLFNVPCDIRFVLEVALEIVRLAWKKQIEEMNELGLQATEEDIDEETERREIAELLIQEYEDGDLPCCKGFELPAKPSPDLVRFCPEIAPYCDPEYVGTLQKRDSHLSSYQVPCSDEPVAWPEYSPNNHLPGRSGWNPHINTSFSATDH